MTPKSVRACEVVRVKPEKAFRLFTEHVAEWYRIDQYTVPDVSRTVSLRIEGHVGGHFIAVTDELTGSGDVLGTVAIWEPPVRLMFVDLNGCEVEVTFIKQGQSTLVAIEVTGVEKLDPALQKNVQQYGWHTTLGWYINWMERAA